MVLKTCNLCKVYKQGYSTVSAVRNVNIDILEHKYTAITGTSGCGKTTLLYLLSGIEVPSAGKVLLNNEDLSSKSSAKRAAIRSSKFGFVFQDYSLISIMTAMENITTQALLTDKKPDKEYIFELCDILGISNRLNHLPCEMSGGEQQRVAVARALVNKPDIIFADEPTGNLDKKSASELLELLLLTKNKFNQTLLIVTHDLDIASRADIVIHMDNGEII